MGIFAHGASPDGVLDMSGNVREWTCSLWGEDWQNPEFGYPYDPADGRENLAAPDGIRRVLRGGAFNLARRDVRSAYRYFNHPIGRNLFSGFRVVSPGLLDSGASDL